MSDFIEALKTPLPEGTRRLSKLVTWVIFGIWPIVLFFGVETGQHGSPHQTTYTRLFGMFLDGPPEAVCILSIIIIIPAAIFLVPKIAQIILWVKAGYKEPDDLGNDVIPDEKTDTQQ
jgi:hypothetical protein